MGEVEEYLYVQKIRDRQPQDCVALICHQCSALNEHKSVRQDLVVEYLFVSMFLRVEGVGAYGNLHPSS